MDVTSEGSTFLRPDAFVGLQPMAWDYVAPAAGIPPSLYCGTPMRAEPEIRKDPVGLTGLVSKFCLDVVPWYYQNNHGAQSPAMQREGDELLAPVLWQELTLVAFSGKGCPPRLWKLPAGWESVQHVAIREIKPDGLKALARLQVRDGNIRFGLAKGQGVAITPTR